MLLKLYKSIVQGHRLYKDLIAGYNPGERDYILVFPESNKTFNYQCLLYLDSFYAYLEYVRRLVSPISVVFPPAGNFYIAASEKSVAESAHYFSGRIAGAKIWNRAEMEDFMRYYCIAKPENIIIVSLERPNGRSCSHLAGVKGLDVKTIILTGIYGISHDFSRDLKMPPLPVYDGGDPVVGGFINGA